MATLPYITAPGNIEKALNGIKSASTPEKVTQDFVKTILKIPGGSGTQITSFLKKIGFVNTDGTPSEVYKSFRNPGTSGKAILSALKIGYKPLYSRNEYMHAADDATLRGLIIEETGAGDDSSVVGLVLSAINGVRKFLKAGDVTDSQPSVEKFPITIPPVVPPSTPPPNETGKLGMNLSYTINLNLPATSDIAVFNAIFKSIKEHLIRDSSNES